MGLNKQKQMIDVQNLEPFFVPANLLPRNQTLPTLLYDPRQFSQNTE